VLEAISEGASTPDQVASVTDLEIGEAMVAITRLELDGSIEVDPSGTLLRA
jgi:hypothetical protein